MKDDFERWLTGELNSTLGGLSPRSRALAAFRGGPAPRRGVTLKAGALAVAAVLVTSGVALAAGTAITGTPNPTAWGRQVSEQVESCKQQLKPGEHGIGKCVSSFAKRHGRGHSGAHGHGSGHGPDDSATPEPNESPEPLESPGPGETPAASSVVKHASPSPLARSPHP